MPRPPAERLETGAVVVRRARSENADAVARAVYDSLEHLRPWMPWATKEAATVAAQRQRLIAASGRWEDGAEYDYLIVTPDGSEVVGACGMHRRVGEGGIEIGYWLHARHIGHGYARSAASALTAVALALDGIVRVEIHCDEANVASQAIPRALGYQLDRVEPRVIEAPGEIGRRMIWVRAVPGTSTVH